MTAESAGTRPARKATHMVLSLIAAGVVAWLPPLDAAAVLAAATFVALAVELARRVSPTARAAFQRMVGGMLKDRERGRITGATGLSLSFTLTALLYPGSPALAGILFAGLGDPVASLVGRCAPGPRFPGGKSPAGTAAFAAVVFAVGVALGMDLPLALITALLLSFVEAFSLRVDDNLYLPLAGAAAVVLGGLLTSV